MTEEMLVILPCPKCMKLEKTNIIELANEEAIVRNMGIPLQEGILTISFVCSNCNTTVYAEIKTAEYMQQQLDEFGEI